MTGLQDRFGVLLRQLPLIAILRGITTPETDAVGDALVAAGFGLIEVPLNSPDPFASIARLVARFGDRALIGAGTVTDPAEVAELQRIGAHLVISPHTDLAVIAATRAAGLVSLPGCATPSECFAALKAGADALKLFPMEVIGASGVKAMRAVLPKATRLIAVGGVTPATIGSFAAAGCAGFGLGSALYAPGKSASDVAATAREFVAAARALPGG